MDVVAKLQVPTGQGIRLVNAPTDAVPGLGGERGSDAGAVMVFVRSSEELARHLTVIVEAGRADRLTWVAYPKAGQLGTDLNRDRLAALLHGHGVRPVRQVALDGTWSALRFRPA